MSRAASPFTERRYGVARVTREWEMARSSFTISGPSRHDHPGAAAAWTEDRLERRRATWENPRGAGGFAVLRRGPSQSVGAAAFPGSAHVEGAGVAADARSAVAGAVAHASEARESPHRHDHHRAAQRSLGQRPHPAPQWMSRWKPIPRTRFQKPQRQPHKAMKARDLSNQLWRLCLGR